MQQVFFDPRQFVAGQQVQRDTKARNALADLAPAAIQGNENALAQLAQYAPEMAMDIRDRADQRRVRQEGLDLERQRVGIAQQRLTADQQAQARSIMEAQTEEERKASLQALKAMQNGYARGNRSIFETGLAALKGIDPDTPDHVTFDNFAEMAPMLDGMVEIYATLEAPKLSAAEAQIARLMETGLDRNTAINIADGVWVMSTNPQTGEVQIIDKATRQPVAPLQPPQAQQTQTEPGRRPELSFSEPASEFGEPYQASDRAFGIGGALRGTVNAVGDAVGLGQAFPDVGETKRDFKVLREQLTGDLASGNNFRQFSWLVKQIQELTPDTGSPLEGREAAQGKLAAIGRSIDLEIEKAENQLSNRQLRPNVRQEQQAKLDTLRSARNRILNAYQSFGSGQGQGAEISPDVQERMRAYE